MTMTLVKSTNLFAVGYEAWSATLEIHFRNGSVYEYLDVPPGVYDALVAAESPGQFHRQNIIDHYHFRRIL